jgi:hypothetical protein
MKIYNTTGGRDLKERCWKGQTVDGEENEESQKKETTQKKKFENAWEIQSSLPLENIQWMPVQNENLWVCVCVCVCVWGGWENTG